MGVLTKIWLYRIEIKKFELLKNDWNNYFPHFLEELKAKKNTEDFNNPYGDKLLELIEANNVKINQDNIVLFEYCGLDFLIKNLVEKIKEDFYEGMSLYFSLDQSVSPSAKEDCSKKIQELKNSIKLPDDFVLNSTNISIVKIFPELIYTSLKNDPVKTMDMYEELDDDTKSIFLGEHLNDILNVLSNSSVNMEKFPAINFLMQLQKERFEILKNGEKLYSQAHADSLGYMKIIKKFQDVYQKSPFAVPDYVMRDTKFLNSVIESPEDRKLILDIQGRAPFSNETEKQLLLKLGNGCKKLEEQIYLMSQENKQKSDMNEYELLVTALYIKKLLFINNLTGCTVNVHKYIREDASSNYIESTKEININAYVYKTSFKKMIHSGVHEVMHAIQSYNMEHDKIERDESILYYEKDRILKDILGPEYDKDGTNYFKISYEFDADFRTIMQCAYLFKEEDNLFEKYKNFGIEELKQDRNFLEQLGNKTRFVNTTEREWKGKTYHIDDLFCKALNKCIMKGKRLKEIKSSRLLNLEYKLSYPVRKKNVKEILDTIFKENDEVLFTKGLKIIEIRLKNMENKKEYEKEIMYLRSVHDDPMCPYEVRCKIARVLQILEHIEYVKRKLI